MLESKTNGPGTIQDGGAAHRADRGIGESGASDHFAQPRSITYSRWHTRRAGLQRSRAGGMRVWHALLADMESARALLAGHDNFATAGAPARAARLRAEEATLRRPLLYIFLCS